MRLEDKVSIITGGGSGMGRTAALMFAAEGAKVVVADYAEAAGAETVRLVREAGGEATFVRTDISSEPDAKAMVDHAVATYGRVDTLYNNAGIMPEEDHSVIDTPVDAWDRVMAVNVRGVYLGCKYAIPQMLEQGTGSIINVASFVAILGCSVPQDAYTSSKGAVLALTRSLAVQFAGRGVRSNSISPGPVETPLLMEWLLEGRGGEAAPARPQPDRPVRQAGGDRERGDLPRVRRVALDERRQLRHRRRDQRQLLLTPARGPADAGPAACLLSTAGVRGAKGRASAVGAAGCRLPPRARRPVAPCAP